MATGFNNFLGAAENSDNGWSYRVTVVSIIASLDEVRVRFAGGTTAGTIVWDHVSIGKWLSEGTNGAVTTATPIELKFDGLSGVTVPNTGGPIGETYKTARNVFWSDWTSLGGLSWAAGDKLVVIMDQNAGAGASMIQNSNSTLAAGSTTGLYDTFASYNLADPGRVPFGTGGLTIHGVDWIETRKSPIFIPAKTIISPKRNVRQRQKAY